MADGAWLLAKAMLGPIYALFVEDLGGDLVDAGLTFGVFAFAAGITTLIVGSLSDRVKEDELIISAGFLITAFGFFYYIFVDSLATLMIAQVIIGLGEATKFPAYDEVFSKHLDKGTGGREWGAWEALSYFTAAIGAVGGGYLAAEMGFDAIFIIMGALSLWAAIFIYRLPRKVL